MSDRPLERYLRLLAGEIPGDRLLEVRYRCTDGMGQRFIPAARVTQAAAVIDSLAAHSDTYVGVLLRDRRAGGREAVSRGRLLFVEVDAEDAAARVDRAPAPATMLISSGTAGHLHAYWLLDRDAGAAEIQSANRKLAHHLGGDLASVDAARILRPPGSLNHKHEPPAPVRLRLLDRSRVYTLEQLTDGLIDPDAARERQRAAATERRLARLHDRQPLDTATAELDARLRGLDSRDYVLLLAALDADRQGKVSCPFHQDRTPSLQCYPGGTWHCFGCRAGGSIYDFAARLWGLQTRGQEFLKLRERLAEELGIPTGAPPHRSAAEPRTGRRRRRDQPDRPREEIER